MKIFLLDFQPLSSARLSCAKSAEKTEGKERTLLALAIIYQTFYRKAKPRSIRRSKSPRYARERPSWD